MIKEVEVIDVETGIISLVPSNLIGPEMLRINYKGKLYWANETQLRRNEYQHNAFVGDIKKRIKSIMNGLSEVYPLSYEEWEDGFRRDQNPRDEISIWENIVSQYKQNTGNCLDLEYKKEVYSILIRCSISEHDQVLNQVTLKKLSKDQAKIIIGSYYNET